jgi:ketosteroid isomerase-like protein
MRPERPFDLVRLAWQAAERDGVPALLAFAADDIVWIPLLDRGRTLHGRAAVERFGQDLARDGTEVTISGDEFEDHGDHVVISGRVRVYSRNGHYDEPMHWRVGVSARGICRVSSARTKAGLDA